MVRKALLILLMLFASAFVSTAQVVEMTFGEEDTVQIEDGSCITISMHEIGAGWYNYSRLVIEYTPGQTLYLIGTCDIFPYSAEGGITITDGQNVETYKGHDEIVVTGTSGEMEVVLVAYLIDAANIDLVASLSPCMAELPDVRISDIDAHSVSFECAEGAQGLAVSGCNGEVLFENGEAILMGLVPVTSYSVLVYDTANRGSPCCMRQLDFVTIPEPSYGCIDALALNSPSTVLYVGDFMNPYAEIVEADEYFTSYSRHSIFTNPLQTDSYTLNDLYVVPPGAEGSVKLGNRYVGAEAEAIMYAMRVDTLVSDLLILKYAAVLEDPGHAPEGQPRFRMEILDKTMNLIDSSCTFADFISSQELGWNTGYYDVLWKDWTTIGVDLTPYHGQTILVRFTTYDCLQGAHFGYAYFTLECARKSMHTTKCGDTDSNTFVAPAGFNYMWYSDTTTYEVLSTDNSLTVETAPDTTYYCQLSFVDNEACNFTMSSFAGVRWPLALFDTLLDATLCNFDIDLINRSAISSDGINPIVGNNEQCETALWTFGDGDTARTYNAHHHYAQSGEYTITLVSGIANDACLDTTSVNVTVELAENLPYIVGPVERCPYAQPDTLRVVGAVSSSWEGDMLVVAPLHDTVCYVTALTDYGCDITLKHYIHVLPARQSTVYDTVWEYDLPRVYNGTEYYNEVYHERVMIATSEGCDSIVDYSLVILHRLPISVAMPETLCGGMEIELGLTSHPVTTLGHRERIFLPDGVECGDGGCSYRSYVTFTDFGNGDVVNSVNDINYIMVNMEHSYIGDIYIGVTCPNGQQASLMNWSSAGTSNCTYAVPMSHRGWQSGSNTNGGTFLGMAKDGENGLSICDSSAVGNEPGIGWNYCWSDNTAAGITYAPGEGSLIYRSAHRHNGRIDSSDVQNLSNFYHPDQGFSNLVGCPLNGDWYIEVIDAYNGDNGYIFGWDLSLNANRIISSETCDIAYTEVEGPWVTQVDDTTYAIAFPSTISHDTTISYNCTIVDVCGNRGDTVVDIVLHSTVTHDTADTICYGSTYFFAGNTLYSTGVYYDTLVSAIGCDSVVRLSLVELPHYITDVYDTIRERDLPRSFGGREYYTDVVADTHQLLSQKQCDSVVVYNLKVLWNTYFETDTIACPGELPMQLGQLTLSEAGTTIDTILNHEGGDSIVTITINAHEAYLDSIDVRICYGESATLGDDTYSESGVYTAYLTTEYGCDSVVVMNLTVVTRPVLDLRVEPLCYTKSYSITADVDASGYFLWSSIPADTLFADTNSGASVEVQPPYAVTYICTAGWIVDGGECAASGSIMLMPIITPTAGIKCIPSLLHVDDLAYTAHDVSFGRNTGRTWYIDGEEQPEQTRSISRVADASADSVNLMLVAHGDICPDTAYMTIPIYNVGVFAPNVFTPSEGSNQRFVLGLNGIDHASLTIYDRHGILVYHTDNAEDGWDGRDKDGRLCCQDNYVWHLEYYGTDYPTRRMTKVGTVLLLR